MSEGDGMITQMAARLDAQPTLGRALDTILADSIAFVGARCGLIRLIDDTGSLLVVAQRRFDRDFMLKMDRISLSATTASARAVVSRSLVCIPDIDDDSAYAPLRELAHRARFRAVFSIPMTTHSGACIGVISVHFEDPHVPTQIEQSMLETYGKIAADRVLALLGSEPLSIRAQALFERAFARTPDVETEALPGTRG